MEIRITSIAKEGLSKRISEITVTLESKLKNNFKDFNFGDYQQLMILIIAAGDDNINESFRKKNSKSGSYTHFLTKQKIKFYSIPVLFPTEELASLDSQNDLRERLILGIYNKIHECIATTDLKGNALNGLLESLEEWRLANI